MKKSLFYLIATIFLTSCFEVNPNLNNENQDVLEEKLMYIDRVELNWQDTIYIPIYSDIYSETKDVRFNLTATLSIRNTNLTDSIFIEDIDYYDSYGKKVRQYLDRVLLLQPMQSIEYVIAENDTAGGTGANFIVNWGSNSNAVRPLFQGVMISTHGQQGISFLTEGVSISRR